MIQFEKKPDAEKPSIADIMLSALNVADKISKEISVDISATDFDSAETVIDQFAEHYGKDFKLKFHVTIAQV